MADTDSPLNNYRNLGSSNKEDKGGSACAVMLAEERQNEQDNLSARELSLELTEGGDGSGLSKSMQTIFTLNDIKTNDNKNEEFIKLLNKKKGCTLMELINYAQSICPDLNNYSINDIPYNERNKGMLGEIIEYMLFGQRPNSSSNPDLPHLETDIKCTNFNFNHNRGYNAKERLTITNFGQENNIASFSSITNNLRFKDTTHYKKLRKGILFAFQYNKINTLESILNRKFIGVIKYDLEKLPDNFKTVIQNDFDDIKGKILSQPPNFTQSGQKKIHMCKHGNGGGCVTRALAFTQKFVTELFCIFSDNQLLTRGNSIYFR